MDAPPPVLTLVVEKGPRKGAWRQSRASAALRVGRVVKGNDLAVRDKGSSERHLVVEFLPPPIARWAVTDVSALGGTMLNGERLAVPRAPLSHGDVIKVGDSTELAVSIAAGMDANPAGVRRSSRLAVVEKAEAPDAATRCGKRKKPAADAAEAEKEKLRAAMSVVEENFQVVTRHGGRKNRVGCHGGRKKAAQLRDPEDDVEDVLSAVGAARRVVRKTTDAPKMVARPLVTPKKKRSAELGSEKPVVAAGSPPSVANWKKPHSGRSCHQRTSGRIANTLDFV